MIGCFISYRRDDSAPWAGRLHDRLTASTDTKVFFDIDSIDLGQDFRTVIASTLESCDVVLVLIGPTWLEPDEHGRRRLDEQSDFHRIEIASALQSGLRVIPVLVGGAAMPSASELPEDLQSLAFRNALSIDHASFSRDVEVLERALSRVEPRGPTAAAAAVGAGSVADASHSTSGSPPGESPAAVVSSAPEPTQPAVGPRPPPPDPSGRTSVSSRRRATAAIVAMVAIVAVVVAVVVLAGGGGDGSEASGPDTTASPGGSGASTEGSARPESTTATPSATSAASAGPAPTAGTSPTTAATVAPAAQEVVLPDDADVFSQPVEIATERLEAVGLVVREDTSGCSESTEPGLVRQVTAGRVLNQLIIYGKEGDPFDADARRGLRTGDEVTVWTPSSRGC